jgi:hypothetical protein
MFRTSLLEIGLFSLVYLPRDNIDETNGVLGLNKAWLIWPVCTAVHRRILAVTVIVKIGCYLLPLPDGNLSAHLLAMRSVDSTDISGPILTLVTYIYLMLRKVFLIKTSVVDP